MDRGAAAKTGTLTDFLVVLLKHRRFLVWNTVVVTALALAVSFLLPVRYKAVATLFPPQEEGEGLFGLGALIEQFDMTRLGLTGATTSAQIYLAILKSRTIADRVIEEFDLVARYKAKNVEAARKVLGRSTSFKLSSAGMIEIAVEDRDRERAAALANAFAAHLDDLNRNLRRSEGKRTREFVEERLVETREKLRASEDSLRAFQEAHPGAIVPADLAASAGAAADLMAQRVAAGVDLEILRSTLKPDAAPLRRKQSEIDALDRELGTLPAMSLEAARRFRDFKVQETLFELLTARYEDARIRELKDVTTVDVLDAAVPPVRKSFPRRGLIAAAAAALSVVFGVSIAVLRETFAGLDPAADPRIAGTVRPGTFLHRVLFGSRRPDAP